VGEHERPQGKIGEERSEEKRGRDEVATIKAPIREIKPRNGPMSATEVAEIAPGFVRRDAL